MQATSVRLPSDLKSWLAQKAANEGRSLNGQIVQVIKAAKAADFTEGDTK
jgi:hypothetical protein